MKCSNLICAAVVMTLLATGNAHAGDKLHWEKKESSIALMNNNVVVWKFNYGANHGKPFFHPIALTDGTVLSCEAPGDHPWHHGLWFCWKYINGLNYWEEDRKTGLSEGITAVTAADVKTTEAGSASINLTLSYHPPEKAELLSEKRTITVSTPDTDGNYFIDWVAIFKATGDDVTLDRTPLENEPGGKSWGGYAGMSIRMQQDGLAWTFLNSEGLEGAGLSNQKARWVRAGSKTASGKYASLTIMDHPSNMRYPSPWYLIPDMPYFSPALLYREAHLLKKGESFALRYRVCVRSGDAGKETLDLEWKSFSAVK